MREIVLDTETTGLDPESGHRIVEVGCLELINHIPSGEAFHAYVNPERDMPSGAFEIHGLSEEFLAGKPLFGDVADGLLAFIGDSVLVIHNAQFDLGFLNAELARIGRAPLPEARAIDTVSLARRRFPGAPANLDALCRRFGIDNAARTKHGALLDAELLAEVYLELIGGRQPSLGLGAAREAAAETREERPARPPRRHEPDAEESAAHAAFIGKLNDPIWLR
ncbi:MAG: DNA polymerase III subunit epsilon [Defluviicoccus sp.]|nr:DNA polymerase III subunit epsilon [Defluviicoccus sp.]MDE0384200.1 DNA polymerase III subunit epsilon [Defluviicoccus sp.]